MAKMTTDYGSYEKIRNERGLTDFAVSRETGIAAATLSDWKLGKSNPKPDKLLTLARFFSVPMETFMIGD